MKLLNWLCKDHQKSSTLNESIIISKMQLLIFRICMMIFYIAVFIWDVSASKDTIFTPFKFITQAGFILGLIYFVGIVIETASYQKYQVVRGSAWKIINIIFELAFSFQLLPFIYYWAFLIPKYGWNIVTGLELSVHTATFICIWIDNIFNAIRFYHRHVTIIMFTFSCYMMINFCVYLKGDIEYTELNWITAISYLIVGAFLALTLLHFYFGMWYFNVVKSSIIKKKNQRKQEKIKVSLQNAGARLS